MNLGQLRSRIRLALGDLDESRYLTGLVDAVINEAIRKLCIECLPLENNSSALVYNSTYDGFALPATFMRVKSLQWTDSNGERHSIEATSLEEVYRRRTSWINLNAESAAVFNPTAYCIHNGYIILDSTTQTSPNLYYYSYDATLAGETVSPTIPEEMHVYICDYTIWQLSGDMNAYGRWNEGLDKMRQRKHEKTEGIRSKYVGL